MGVEGTTRAWACRGFAALFAAVAVLLFVPFSAEADEVDWMYQPDALVEINLGGLSEAELDQLELEPDEEVSGTFELKVEGVPKAVFAEVGIRLKGGHGSFRPVKTGKAAFKIRFDKFVNGQLFFGLQRLTLNNMVQDASMVHETLTYELFRALGLPASRTGYALVTLNGEYYGVYLNIETLDKIFLEKNFESTQHLYEADVAGVDVRVGEADTFEVDRGKEDDLSDLEALIAAANSNVDDWSDGMAVVADLTRMTRVWAVERYVGHWDGYAGLPHPNPGTRPNNYYLHSLGSGVFEMLPWGADQTWETDIAFDEPAGGLLFNKCIEDESCKALYDQALEEVRAAAPGLELDQRASDTAELLDPWQDMESEVRRGFPGEEIAEVLEETRDLIPQRAEELDAYLDPDELQQPEEPQKPQQPHQPQQPIIDPPPHAATAKFGASRLAGSFVVTSLQIDGAGSATQQVTARLEGERLTVCADRGSRSAAGRLTLRCKLSKKAQGALAAGPLKFRVQVRFVPGVGAPTAATRSFAAPARS